MKFCYIPKIIQLMPILNHPPKTHHPSFSTLHLTPSVLNSQSSTLRSSLCILQLPALQQRSEFDIEETLLVYYEIIETKWFKISYYFADYWKIFFIKQQYKLQSVINLLETKRIISKLWNKFKYWFINWMDWNFRFIYFCFTWSKNTCSAGQ